MAAIKGGRRARPENATYHNTLGVVRPGSKRPRRAQAASSRPGDRQEQSRGPPQSRARLCGAGPLSTRPVTAYKKALAFPAYATPEVAYYNLGNAYIRLGKAPEAEESYRAAVQLEPTSSPPLRLGLALMRGGSADQAKESFGRPAIWTPPPLSARPARISLKQLEDGR